VRSNAAAVHAGAARRLNVLNIRPEGDLANASRNIHRWSSLVRRQRMSAFDTARLHPRITGFREMLSFAVSRGRVAQLVRAQP
jgi:hypothetical protein